jgi:hypothetical protein
MGEAAAHTGGVGIYYQDLGAGLWGSRINPSTEDQYIRHFSEWEEYMKVTKGVALLVGMSELDQLKQIQGFMAYCYYTKNNKASTIAGKLSGISHMHKLKCRVGLPVGHEWIKGIKDGIVRQEGDRVEVAKIKRIRRPMTISMVHEGSGVAVKWGSVGVVKVNLMELAVAWLLRASEYLGYDDGLIHPQYCITRSSVTWWCEGEEVTYANRHSSDRVSIHFRASKGDQRREGVIVSRHKKEGTRSGYEVVMDILERQDEWGFCGMSNEEIGQIPLCAVLDGAAWRVIGRKEQTRALREMIGHLSKGREDKGKVGLLQDQFALHSFRIGGATMLADAGASDQEIRSAGRWKSEAFKKYIMPSIEEARRVSTWLGWKPTA